MTTGFKPLAVAALANCCELGTRTSFADTRISAVNGKTYAIGFEMRLPLAWNGRLFHRVNGGTNGNIGVASGGIGGGGPLSNAPVAKAPIRSAYGKGPDRSYLVGCSNGGRHAMIGAARYADQYDGILAGNPGFNLPKAALAQLYGAQQLNRVATSSDLASSFTLAERTLVASKVLEKCDALDGATDGIVSDGPACRAAFDWPRDVPSCGGASRDGNCLSAQQKTAIGNIAGGARNTAGAALYASFPFDAGITSANWAGWKFSSSIGAARDPVAVAFIFQTPPAPASIMADTKAFALAYNFDTDAPKIAATDGVYTESSWSFMTPPRPTDLSLLKNRGAEMIIDHGVSDGVFSTDDTVAWYEGLRQANAGDASDFARLFLVPGMNHCSGGPATDQFNMVDTLVGWVEKGVAPASVIANARGLGNPGGANADVPASWSPTRTRPLCPYPKVAKYKGSGDIDSAASFSCR